MEYCKVQIGCLLVVAYIAFIYFRECRRYGKKLNSSIFGEMLFFSMFCIIFDGITAVTVNHLDTVDIMWNRIFHLGFLVGIDAVVYMMFGYMMKTTGATPTKKIPLALLHLPYLINIFVVVFFIGKLEFRIGKYTNYSMGISAYTCFGMVGIYIGKRRVTL